MSNGELKNALSDIKPVLVGGLGEKNFGKQYRQGNRVYDSNAIAMCLNAQPVGNAVGMVISIWLVMAHELCQSLKISAHRIWKENP